MHFSHKFVYVFQLYVIKLESKQVDADNYVGSPIVQPDAVVTHTVIVFSSNEYIGLHIAPLATVAHV